MRKVKTYIELRKEEIRKSEEIELSYIISNLKSIILTESVEEVERDGSGNITKTRTKSNNSARNQALALLTKIGGFEAAKKVDVNANVTSVDIKSMLGFDED